MTTRTLLSVLAAVFALVAVYSSRSPAPSITKPFVRGRNNTILFLSNDDLGLANAMVATSYALLTKHSDLEIHYGTHRRFQSPLSNVNEAAHDNKALSKPVTAHIFHGKDYEDSILELMTDPLEVYHKTGWWNLEGFLRTLTLALQPVEPEQYLSTFKQCLALIEEIDPAVVVVEPLFSPGIDAVRMMRRREVMLSPSALQDTLGQFQPNGEVLWKYPAYVARSPYDQ